MKKLVGAISAILVGVLNFVFLSVANLLSKTTAGSTTATSKWTAWEIIKDTDETWKNVNGYTFFKIFAIVGIVVSVLLVLAGVVALLKNLNVLKLKFNIELVNAALLALFALCSILVVVALAIMGNDLSGEILGIKSNYYPAVGAWLNLVFGAIGCSCGLLALGKAKSKKRRK